jgi:UDP-N-acetylmuramoyl-tripeptide--D-alanyl-D-alanine ligase
MLTFASTLEDIARIAHGTLAPAFGARRVTGVSIDSRNLDDGDLFVALPGEKADGHDYVAAALAAGAVGAIVSRVPDGIGVEQSPLIVVPDSLRALGDLGSAARDLSGATVVAVTGSAGKTTVRNMIAAALATFGPTLVAERNLNNEIGCPLTLFRLRPEHRFAVLELAMRGRGQIKYLADICRPHIGVITNVGESHIGLLGSRENIAQAKAELLAALPADGVAALPRDDFFFDLLDQLAPCRVISFGESPDADVRVSDVAIEGLAGVRFRLRAGDEEAGAFVGIPGRHIAINVAAAAAVCLAAGMSLSQAAAGLNGFADTDMRMQTAQTARGYTVVNDTYNASPASVQAALDVLAVQEGRKVFVFGDMLELGPVTKSTHERIGQAAAKAGVDWMVTVGEWASVAGDAAEAAGVRVERFTDKTEALEALKEGLQPGDIVLVKASRGMGLETVARGLVDGA